MAAVKAMEIEIVALLKPTIDQVQSAFCFAQSGGEHINGQIAISLQE